MGNQRILEFLSPRRGAAGKATSTDEFPLTMKLKIIEIPMENQRLLMAAVQACKLIYWKVLNFQRNL